MNTPPVHIIGISGDVGLRKISGEELGKKYRTSAAAIEAVTGVTALYRFTSGESIVKLAASLAINLAVRSGVYSSRYISGVFASCNPTLKTLMPGFATLVASAIEMHDALADQIGMGCAGGMQALRAAYDRLVVDGLNGKKSTYLVIAGDATNVILDEKDRNTGILFSEGVSVLLVTNNPDLCMHGYEITRIGTKSLLGSGVNMMHINNPLHPETPKGDSCKFVMDGAGVKKFGAGAIAHFLELVGKPRFQDDWMLFPHQPNLSMLKEMAKQGNVSEKQVYMEGIRTIGNTSPASVFLGLHDGLRRKLFDATNTVLLGAFGAELTVGAALLKPLGDPRMIGR